MRNSIIEVISVGIVLVASMASASDLAGYEKNCADIGFKKGTQSFGECVLEMDRRSTASQGAASALQFPQAMPTGKAADRVYQTRQAAEQAMAAQQPTTGQKAIHGDGSPDDGTCKGYGFQPGSDGYGQCRMTLDAARNEYQQRQTAYQAAQVSYAQQVAAAEQEEARQRALKKIEFGSRMAAAASQPGATFLGSASTAAAGTAGIQLPDPPKPPAQTSIYQINGHTLVCTQTGNFTHCN